MTKATATLRARLAKGKLFTVEVEEVPAKETVNPWLEIHGSLRDDPTFDDFMAEIAHSRQQLTVECRACVARHFMMARGTRPTPLEDLEALDVQYRSTHILLS